MSRVERPRVSSPFAADGISRRELLGFLAAVGLAPAMPSSAFAATPDGELTWGVHVSLSPSWIDPAETSGLITPLASSPSA